jgi:hypothetical protein
VAVARANSALGKKVRLKSIFKTFVSTALAACLSSFMAMAVQAQNEPLKSEGPLGKLHADEKVKCVKCHGTAKRTEPVSMETCLGCHGDGDSKALAALTAKAKPMNPHENRHYGTEADCSLCHRVHQKSVNFCLDCHSRFDFKMK